MIKNWFTFAAVILFIGATTIEVFKHNWKLAALYSVYGMANFILSTMGN